MARDHLTPVALSSAGLRFAEAGAFAAVPTKVGVLFR
jgi:hypothetical protein